MESYIINNKIYNLTTVHLEGNNQSDNMIAINPRNITYKGNRDFNIFVALFLCPFYSILRFQGQKQGNVCLP